MNRLQKSWRWINNSVAGRLVFGPITAIIRLLSIEVRRLWIGDFTHVTAWLLHIPACAIVLYWVVSICQIPLLDYLVLMVYPGIGLSLLRSYAEHQAVPASERRTAVTEAHPLLGLLFLHNNLHALHHAEPGLPWYQLPTRWQAQRDNILATNGGYYFHGYSEIIRRYLFWPKEPAVHPGFQSNQVSYELPVQPSPSYFGAVSRRTVK